MAKDTTLITIAPLVGIRMWLESSSEQRDGSAMVCTATVKGEATVESLFGRETRTATGSATGKSPNGAQLRAYAACVRAFVDKQTEFPDAFNVDLEQLEKESE